MLSSFEAIVVRGRMDIDTQSAMKIGDTLDLNTQHFKLELQATVDADSSGYGRESGPGAGRTCSCGGGTGAGHGGVGGRADSG